MTEQRQSACQARGLTRRLTDAEVDAVVALLRPYRHLLTEAGRKKAGAA